MGFQLVLTDDAKKFVAEKGFDPQFGARPLHRAIQKYLEDPLAEYILNNNPAEGTVLEAVMNEENDWAQHHGWPGRSQYVDVEE